MPPGSAPGTPRLGRTHPAPSFSPWLLQVSSAPGKSELERHIELADSKHAGVANFQWNLIRDQFVAFAREMASMRQEVATSQATGAEALRLAQALQAELQSRSRDDQGVLTAIDQFKVAFETLDREGLARHAQIEGQLRATEAEREERCRAQAALDSKFQEVVFALETERGQRMDEFASVRAVLERERSERILMSTTFEERCATMRDHIETCSRESREAIGKERLAREKQNATLANELQIKEAALRAGDVALKEQLTEMACEIRQRIERVIQDSDASDAGLQVSQDALQSSMSTKIQDLRDDLSRLTDSILAETGRLSSSMEQFGIEIRGEIGSSVKALQRALGTEEARRSEQTATLGSRVSEQHLQFEEVRARSMLRSDFDVEARRLWEALGSHTHQVAQPAITPSVIVESVAPQVLTGSNYMPSALRQAVVQVSTPSSGAGDASPIKSGFGYVRVVA